VPRKSLCSRQGQSSRTDDAFAALEEGYQSRAEWMAYLNVDPQMDTLCRDRRYTNLLKRLGL